MRYKRTVRSARCANQRRLPGGCHVELRFVHRDSGSVHARLSINDNRTAMNMGGRRIAPPTVQGRPGSAVPRYMTVVARVQQGGNAFGEDAVFTSRR